MRCSERMPGQDRYCAQPDDHTGQHQDEFGVKWSAVLGEAVGFSREELAQAASRQLAKVAPSKDEILAAIAATHGPAVSSFAIGKALRAVEKLFADRGL